MSGGGAAWETDAPEGGASELTADVTTVRAMKEPILARASFMHR